MAEMRSSRQYAKIDMRLISVYELYQWAKTGVLEVDAPYIRALRWSLEGKSRFVESLLEGIPIQAVYLAEMKDGRYTIVDGAQRVKTILEFLDDGFSLAGTYPEWNHLRYSELPMVAQRRIEDFQLVVYIVRGDNETAVQDSIFERLNMNASRFSSQELRNYVYRDKGIPFVRHLAEEDTFMRLIEDKEIKFNLLEHHELVLRFMSFYFKGYESYNGNMKLFLDDTLKHYERYHEEENKFEEEFKQVFQLIDDIWGEDAFVTALVRL